jgi:hypothetical protein
MVLSNPRETHRDSHHSSFTKAAFTSRPAPTRNALRRGIENERGEFVSDAADCEFDLEVIVPLVFNLHLDELRRVQHLSVSPLTGPPPIEPGLGDTLLKAFKKWLSK